MTEDSSAPTRVNVLLIGGGGREHALAWSLCRSPRLGKLHLTHAGNPGLAKLGHAVDFQVTRQEIYRLVQYCERHEVGLVVIGPEDPLAQGYADVFRKAGLPVFGPNADGARIESDKAWCKDLLKAAVVPIAGGRSFGDYEAAAEYLRSREHVPVIKAAGLAKGKGVVLPETLPKAHEVLHAIMVDRVFGDAGAKVVIEDRLTGREVSVLAISDGRTIQLLPTAQDHKRLLDNDQGPNTGGMGAFSPSPMLDDTTLEAVEREILIPTVDSLRREGIDYRGVLYAGLMLTPSGPKVLEYNARFGDPECQVIMPRLKSDALELFLACAQRTLVDLDLEWDPRPTVCIVLASEGYPSKPVTGVPIEGIAQAEAMDDVLVFYSGVRLDERGDPITSGGRVLSVVATAETLEDARSLAYQAADLIRFAGCQKRTDIAL